MTHELAIIVHLVFVVVCVTASDYAGLSFKLDRLVNDKFKNPTTATPTKCNWQPENQKFCTYTNSRCDGDCCQCTCDYATSTFDRSTMKCRKNDEIRNGCKAKFDGKYAGTQIKLLDLSKKGETKIYWPTDIWSDKVKSFDVISIASYHDGSGIQTKFLNKKGKPKKREDGNWEATIKWGKLSKDYHGKLFRVDISYEIERNRKGIGILSVINKNDCFVFKSSGSITVTFPSPPSTTLPPSTTETSTSTSTTPSSSTMPPRRTPSTTTKPPSRPNTPSTPTPKKTTDPVEPSVSTNEISTPTLSMTTQIKESKKTRKPTESTDNTDEPSAPTLAARKEGSAGGNTAVNVSLAAVGCLVLLVVVVLVVLWTRRRSAKASKEKDGGAVDAKGNVDNPMENIYAEADNSINYPEKGKKNYVYDHAEGNLESNYTSLDMSKVESKPTYESLVNVQSNMYEHIPVQGNTSGASGLSGQTPIAENYGREVPGRTGHDDPERVYSVLEDETAESDYMTVLPEKSDYEQPVNPPVPDA